MKSVTIFSLASLLLLAGNVFAFDPLFYARIDYGTGDGPLSVFAVDLDGDGDNDLAVANSYSDDISILINLSSMTGVDNPPEMYLPESFSTFQNYPNPFNAFTIIQYSLQEASDVTIKIYDILGRKIETLVQGEQQAGYHQVIWDAEDATSGMYFYRIQAGDYTEAKKMLLLK